MKLWQTNAALVLLAAVTFSAAPASASPLSIGARDVGVAASEADSLVVQVQRGGGRGVRAAPARGPRGGGGRGGRGRGGDIGAGVAAGIIGLAIGGMIAAEQNRQQNIGYCASRFRSYNPETGTYIGRDGRVRRCP